MKANFNAVKTALIVVIFSAMALGLVFVGCATDNGNDIPPPSNLASTSSTSYESTDADGNTYLLTITNSSARAVYTPKNGDSYVLTIITVAGELKKSNGTVTVIGSNFNLTPIGVTVSFTVTIAPTDSGALQMTNISGTINLTGGGTITVSENLTPKEPKVFNTEELIAMRWTDKNYGYYGEQLKGTEFKLSDFTTVKPKKGYVYRFEISGTIDKAVLRFCLELKNRTEDWSEYEDLPNSNNTAFSAGTFSEKLEIEVDTAPKSIPGADFYIFVSEGLWQKDKDDNIVYDTHTKLPEDTENGDVMATISNFTIRLAEVTQNETTDIDPLDQLPVAERWSVWVEPSASATTIEYSIDGNGVCAITVGGATNPDGWKVHAAYEYTPCAKKTYEYTLEAWTASDPYRYLWFSYYYNDQDGDFGKDLEIDGNRKTYTLYGESIPKSGNNYLLFNCADQIGTFYVKIISIDITSE